MNIAITTTGKGLDSELDPRFGRAQFIIIVDTNGAIVEVIDNETNRAALGGAGISTAKMLVDKNVNVLITGSCGPNARRVLDTAGVEIREGASGSAREAFERFRGTGISNNPTNVPRSPANFGQGASGQPQGPGSGMGRGLGGGGGRGVGRGMGKGMGRGRRSG